MSYLGFSESLQDMIFAILAGVLHVGNIEFREQGESAQIANEEQLRVASKLLAYAPVF
jgi:myosin-1